MSNQSFKVKNGLTLSPIDLTSLLSPQAGDLACDINDSNKIKRYDALSASWVEVGSGASGDVDTLLVQDFDSASLSSFTQTGLTLITTNPLDGRQSARLIHQPLVGAIQSFKETFSVSPKFRGVNMTASLLLRSSASQGNVTIQFRDETNSVDYPSQQLQTNSQVIASLVTNSTTTVSGFSNSVINSLKVGMSVTGSGIPTGTTIAAVNSTALSITLSQAATASATVSLRFSDLPRTIQLGFQIPANCSSYSYTISALQEAGSPETYVDDIVLKNYWLGMSNQGQSEIQTQIIEQQSSNIDQTASFAAATITGVLTSSDGLSLYSYNSTTGIYTALKDIKVDLNASMRTAASSTITPQIYINSIMAASSVSAAIAGTYGNVSTSKVLSAGSTWYFSNASVNITNAQIISVSAQAITTSTTTVNDLVPAKAVLGNTSLEIPNVTSWQGYTPTFQGFGTPSAIEFEWRQVGENVEIRGKFAVGTTTATEARIGLPSGLISANTNLIPSIQNVGTFSRSSVTSGPGTWSTLIEPSVSYMTLGVFNVSFGGLSKRNGNDISVVSGELLSLFASIPCAGLSATEEVVVSGTQSALVQEADSILRIHGTLGYGSTNTRVIRFNNSGIQDNIGSAITYNSNSILGDSFIINEDGIYNINATIAFNSTTSNAFPYIIKNPSDPNALYTAFTSTSIIGHSYSTGGATGNPDMTISSTVKLLKGDIIWVTNPLSTPISLNTDILRSFIQITKQGSLKQLNVSSDQKITIPTSELRFEGASTRGSTATGIVKFDTMTKLRGDAFTVESDSVLGTRITMNKAGKLDISANLYLAGASSLAITRNQSNLTISTTSPASELLSAQGTNSTANRASASWSGFVNIGDIIRVATETAVSSFVTNSLNLSFQEQDISVSVTNTLPQFSESDSFVRATTSAVTFGTSSTSIFRFSSISHNLGSDVVYTDSPASGAQFIARSSGLYSMSVWGQLDSATSSGNVQILINGTMVSIDGNYTASGFGNNIASTSLTYYLNENDIVTFGTNTTSTISGRPVQASVSKVGKPNVTGVDVTPFVNVPQPESQSSFFSSSTGFGNVDITGALTSNTNTGLFSYNPTSGVYTFLKKCQVNISACMVASSVTPALAQIQYNGNQVALASTTTGGAGWGGTASWTGIVTVGDTLKVRNSANGVTSLVYVSVSAEASSDQILTAPETFSTDTASLTYAGSGSYTLSTLANAPIGTFITFTYAANTNTRTQTLNTAPAQTTADMNANGITIYTRPYNSSSPAALPSAIAIQIGKGLKGKSLDLYKGPGKVTAGSLDAFNETSTVRSGVVFKEYNEVTGILIVDAGYNINTSITSALFYFSDVTTQTSGYLVINASKNPALTGLNVLQPRIATLSDVKASGTAGGTATSGSYQTRTLNTLSDPTGIVTSLASNQFILPAGEYYIDASAFAFNCELHKIRIQNITDSTTSLLGSVAYSRVVANAATSAFLNGNIVISSPKTFELQHRTGATQATNGFGLATSFGDNEVYAILKITKVK